jgi:hypothetical protein
MKEIAQATMRGDEEAGIFDNIVQGLWTFVAPFVSPEMGVQKVSEAITGYDQYGNEIDNRVLHVAEGLQPAAIKQITGLIQGKEDSMQLFKSYDVPIKDGIKWAAYSFKEAQREATKKLYERIGGNTATDKQIKESVIEQRELIAKALDDFERKVNVLRRFDSDKQMAAMSLKDAGISKRAISGIIAKADMPVWEINHKTLFSKSKLSGKEIDRRIGLIMKFNSDLEEK